MLNRTEQRRQEQEEFRRQKLRERQVDLNGGREAQRLAEGFAILNGEGVYDVDTED